MLRLAGKAGACKLELRRTRRFFPDDGVDMDISGEDGDNAVKLLMQLLLLLRSAPWHSAQCVGQMDCPTGKVFPLLLET